MVSWFPLLRPFRRRWNRSSPFSRQSRSTASGGRKRWQNPLFKFAVGVGLSSHRFSLTVRYSRDSLRLSLISHSIRGGCHGRPFRLVASHFACRRHCFRCQLDHSHGSAVPQNQLSSASRRRQTPSHASRRQSDARRLQFSVLHGKRNEQTGSQSQVRRGARGPHDCSPEWPRGSAEIPGFVVCLLPRGGTRRRVSRRTHRGTRRALSSRLRSDRGCCVSCLRSRHASQRHLERLSVENGPVRNLRWADLLCAHSWHLWLALAALICAI